MSSTAAREGVPPPDNGTPSANPSPLRMPWRIWEQVPPEYQAAADKAITVNAKWTDDERHLWDGLHELDQSTLRRWKREESEAELRRRHQRAAALGGERTKQYYRDNASPVIQEALGVVHLLQVPQRPPRHPRRVPTPRPVVGARQRTSARRAAGVRAGTDPGDEGEPEPPQRRRAAGLRPIGEAVQLELARLAPHSLFGPGTALEQKPTRDQLRRWIAERSRELAALTDGGAR